MAGLVSPGPGPVLVSIALLQTDNDFSKAKRMVGDLQAMAYPKPILCFSLEL